MLSNWSVTFSLVTPESAEDGDYAECGHDYEATDFRTAIGYFGDYAASADSSPVDGSVRWFDSAVIEDRAHFEQGHDRHLSLHIPDQITPSSRRRLARYLGLKVKPEREPPYSWCVQPSICSPLGYCPRNPNCGN